MLNKKLNSFYISVYTTYIRYYYAIDLKEKNNSYLNYYLIIKLIILNVKVILQFYIIGGLLIKYKIEL